LRNQIVAGALLQKTVTHDVLMML